MARPRQHVYLIDTNVISEARKGPKANAGFARFFSEIVTNNIAVYLSAVSVGELRRGASLGSPPSPTH